MFSSAESSFMSLAMDQAKAAYQNNEVPVGAIIVKDNKVIGKGRNRVIENQNVSSHAEIEAITDASKKIKNYRLNKSTMYVTLEPCHMCLKAMIDARTKLAKAFKDKAKSVNEKYIVPPKTTDFAIVYAPTESLYKELTEYQDPSTKELLTQELMKKYKIVICGPNTLSAYLQSCLLYTSDSADE